MNPAYGGRGSGLANRNVAAVILVEFINGDQPLLQRLGVGNRHRGDDPVRKQKFRAFRVR
jgi:hypothetical protein